jgi:GT2 family glycosyltransferase
MNEISLYIPAYNAENHIEECLESLLKQSLKPNEILVIDDGSTDDTAAIVKKFTHITLLSQPKNLGLAAARNRGIRESKHKLVASIDSDCVAKFDWLENLFISISEDSNLAGVGGKLIERHQEKLADRWRATHLKQHRGDQFLSDPPFLFGHSTIFRKEALEKIGLYHEPLRTNAEDVELSERLVRAGYKISYQPLAVAEHIKHDTILSVIKTNSRYYFFGYFYNINFGNFWLNMKRNGFRRIKEVLTSDLKNKNIAILFLSVAAISYWVFHDFKYVVTNHGKRRLYD